MTRKASKRTSKIESSGKMTMDKLLAKHGSAIKSLERGTKVKGAVISKSSKRLVLDIDRKSEGLVAEKAFNEARDYIKTLEVGDEVTASVIIPETPEGYTILSLRQAKQDAAWERILKAKKEKAQVVVLGVRANPSGITVEVEGIYGFVPNSQLGKGVSDKPQDLVGEHFKVIVIEADRSAKKIVLSEKEVSEAEDIRLTKRAIKKLKESEIYKGKVTYVADFGCFVQIEVPLGKKQKASVEGLIHISEVSWDKVENLRSEFNKGDKVEVKVIGINGSKVAFSIKQAKGDPWDDAKKKYKVDSKHKGKVVKLSDFGVFVQLEPGIEGLIHMTKIPPGKRLERGEEMNVYVEEIDAKDRKLSLGLVLTVKPIGYK